MTITRNRMLAFTLLGLSLFPVAASAEGTQAVPKEFAKEYTVGPLKLAFGPQEDGGFGATLKGTESKRIGFFNNDIDVNPRPKSVQWGRYGALDFDIDAGLSSAPDALNNTSLSLKPRLTFVGLLGREAPIQRRQFSAEDQKKCQDLDAAYGKAIEARDNAAKFRLIQQVGEECDSYAVPIDDFVALSLYPDIRYRYGHFEVDGTLYNANQSILGVGARLFTPVRLGGLFLEWPYISVGYQSVQDTSESSIPVPQDIKADYVTVDAAVNIHLPYPRGSLSQSPLQLLISLKASIPTESEGSGKQLLSHIQLAYDTGSEIKPAITYRSGDDQGLKYDKQVIMGVVWALLGPKQ